MYQQDTGIHCQSAQSCCVLPIIDMYVPTRHRQLRTNQHPRCVLNLHIGGGSARSRFIVVYTSLQCIVFVATVVLFSVRSCRVVLPDSIIVSITLPRCQRLLICNCKMYKLRMCIHPILSPLSDLVVA